MAAIDKRAHLRAYDPRRGFALTAVAVFAPEEFAVSGDLSPICPDCARAGGLCHRDACRKAVLPQLAQNRGWLKMIGDVLTEQKDRQSKTMTADEEAAVAKIGRRNARKVAKQKRGYFALALAIQGKRQRPALEPKDTVDPAITYLTQRESACKYGDGS